MSIARLPAAEAQLVQTVASGHRQWLLFQPSKSGGEAVEAVKSQLHTPSTHAPGKTRKRSFLRSATLSGIDVDSECEGSCPMGAGKSGKGKGKSRVLARMATQDIIEEIDQRTQEVQELLQLGQAAISSDALTTASTGVSDGLDCLSMSLPSDIDCDDSDASLSHSWNTLSLTADDIISGLNARLSAIAEAEAKETDSTPVSDAIDCNDGTSTTFSSRSSLSSSSRCSSPAASVAFQVDQTISSFADLAQQQMMVNEMLLGQVQDMQDKISELQQKLVATQEERDGMHERNQYLQAQLVKVLGCSKGGWIL